MRATSRSGGAALRLVFVLVSMFPGVAAALEPLFITFPPTDVPENQAYSYTFQAVDLDIGDTVVYGAPLLPSWLAFNGVNTISGTPLAEHIGSHTVTVTASDATSTTTQTFQINVHNVDDPPRLVAEIAPDPQMATEREPYSFSVAAFFADPDGDELSFAASNLPPGLNIDGRTGVISGTPRGPRRGDAPSYGVTVSASSSGGTAADSFTLIVNNRNDPPVIPDPPPVLSIDEDRRVDFTPATLNAVDEDPEDQMTVVLTPPGAGAHFTVTNGGTSVQPESNYSGPLQVEARVRDLAGATSNAVIVTINVAAINDAPTATTIPPQAATEGSAFSLNLSAYFSDVEDDRLSYQASGLPPGLSVDSASGIISGTPPIGIDAGDFAVNVTVDDGASSTAAQFTTTLVRIGRADLAASVTVAPNPSLVGNPATWTLSVQNNGQSDAANIALDAVLSADVPLTFDAPSDSACILAATGNQTQVSCRLGPIAASGSVSVTIAGRSTQAGAAHAAVEVSILDAVPLDPTPDNDRASVSLSIAERLSAGPAQRLVVTDARAGAAGDLNGDGFADLAIAAGSNRGPLVFLNVIDPANAAKRALAATAADLGDTAAGNGVGIADLDGDGDLDIVTANAAGQTNKVFTNAGNATFTAAPLTGSTAASNAVALGDVDGDGRIDAVFANAGQSAVYLNRSSSFARAQSLAPAASRDAVLVNLFGTPLPELVLANTDTDAHIYANNAGTLQQSVAVATGPTTSVAAADFDGDGDLDLVFGRGGTAGATAAPTDIVYLNNAGAFASTVELPGSGTVDVLTADVDLDGDQDIVSISPASGQRVYMNAGNATFALHAEQFVHAGATAGTAGLFSVDDRIDVTVAGAAAAGVFVNDGRGNLGPGDGGAPAVNLVGERTVAVTVGAAYQDPGATAMDDIDGDLTADIVVKNPVDTAVLGTYSVTYDVTDSSGNAAPTATRTVDVKPETTGGGGGGALGLELLALLLGALSSYLSPRPTWRKRC